MAHKMDTAQDLAAFRRRHYENTGQEVTAVIFDGPGQATAFMLACQVTTAFTSIQFPKASPYFDRGRWFLQWGRVHGVQILSN